MLHNISQTDVDPPSRRFVDSPELLLLDTMMELAFRRVTIIQEFARNWATLRNAPDYELHRARCKFHLEWIFDDEPTEQFTFRELCQFSRMPAMQEVEPARQRIRNAFSAAAAREMEKPVSARLQRHVQCDWLVDRSSTSDSEPVLAMQLMADAA